MQHYVERCWSDPAVPTFAVNYYRDFSSVSEIIVGTPVFLGISADGGLTCSDGHREVPADAALPIPFLDGAAV